MNPIPEPLTPACICKLGNQIGCYDPTNGHVFGIHMFTPSHSAQFWSWLESIPYQHDIIVLSDDPSLRTTIMANTQRLAGVIDFCPEFQPGFPYECYPPMVMAMHAVSLVRTLKAVDDARLKKG